MKMASHRHASIGSNHSRGSTMDANDPKLGGNSHHLVSTTPGLPSCPTNPSADAGDTETRSVHDLCNAPLHNLTSTTLPPG